MKKKLLLMMLCAPVMLAAQGNGVKVSNFAVSAGTPSTVTFDVSWNRDAMPVDVWSDTVWVFVDYNKNGVMERLPVTGGTATAGTVTKLVGNDQGLRVVGNAREEGVFSATVQLFTAIVNVSGACAYASNYPPVAEYITAQTIQFTGTPIYKIVLKETAGAGTLTDYSEGAYTLRAGYAIQSFTDATGAPGLFHCTMPAVQTLNASAAGYCEGTAGVQFSLRNTENGVVYQLYRDDTPLPGATLNGSTGSAKTFSGTFAAGVYHAEALPGATCPAIMAGTHTITMYPLPAPPTIAGPSSACVSATIVAVPGDHGTGIRWTDISNTVPVRTVTSSGNYNAVSISAYGCVSTTRTFVSRIAVPATAGSTPDPLCCCACGLSVSDGKCAAASTGLTLAPYVSCNTNSNSSKSWSSHMVQALCPLTNDCLNLRAYTGSSWCIGINSDNQCMGTRYSILKCSNASCANFTYTDETSTTISGGRCWQ